MMKINFVNIKWLSRVAGIESDATKDILTLSRLFRHVATDAAPVASQVTGKNTDVSSRPLVDLIGRRHNYLRISLTERCNLRCQYCMPAEGVALSPRAALLSTAEVLRLARVFASLGVDKVRLTGGEPTLRADLADIVRGLNEIEGIRSVSMTTNGLVLTRRLPALQRAGLAAVNVSLDSLRPDRYERMARRPGLSRVLAGVDLALQLGYRPVKINTVLMRGFNDDEILDFVEYTRDREIEVRFIEFMPFSGNGWDDSRMVPQREALQAVRARHAALQPQPPRLHDTATVWRVPGYAGSVGFISSMTQNFCSSCNRLRITADGNLKVCLFGAAEVSLRAALRGEAGEAGEAGAPADDAALRRLVRAALQRKRPRHAGTYRAAAPPARRVRRVRRGRRRCHAARCFSRYGQSRAHGQPPDDSHRRLAAAAALLARRRGSVGTFAARGYCTRAADGGGGAFTHLDAEGRARMVDVGGKPVTARAAAAECRLVVGGRLLRLLRDARLPKGDALAAAELAGVLAAKRTAELIPLCHPLPLDAVRVRVSLPRGGGDGGGGGALVVRCDVRVTARTGAEMEALVGCAVAALTLYDMCKAVDRGMRLTDLRVVRKTGGASGDWAEPPAGADGADGADGAAEPREAVSARLREAARRRGQLDAGETYVPTNLTHF